MGKSRKRSPKAKGSGARKGPPSPRSSESQVRPPVRSRRIWGILAAVLVVLSGLVYFVAGRGPEGKDIPAAVQPSASQSASPVPAGGFPSDAAAGAAPGSEPSAPVSRNEGLSSRPLAVTPLGIAQWKPGVKTYLHGQERVCVDRKGMKVVVTGVRSMSGEIKVNAWRVVDGDTPGAFGDSRMPDWLPGSLADSGIVGTDTLTETCSDDRLDTNGYFVVLELQSAGREQATKGFYLDYMVNGKKRTLELPIPIRFCGPELPAEQACNIEE